jgi:hypothetical protein
MCQNNLHQTSIVLTMYSGDNGDYMPPRWDADEYAGGVPVYSYEIINPWRWSRDFMVKPLVPYGLTGQLAFCPSSGARPGTDDVAPDFAIEDPALHVRLYANGNGYVYWGGFYQYMPGSVKCVEDDRLGWGRLKIYDTEPTMARMRLSSEQGWKIVVADKTFIRPDTGGAEVNHLSDTAGGWFSGVYWEWFVPRVTGGNRLSANGAVVWAVPGEMGKDFEYGIDERDGRLSHHGIEWNANWKESFYW